MNAWRCVYVDDKIPLGLFGNTTLVGVRPLMIWPLLLSKAAYKLAQHYRVLHREAPDEVQVVSWFTGWERERLGVETDRGLLYDKILDVVRTEDRVRVGRHRALPTVFLRDYDEPPMRPKLIVLCGPPGVGKCRLMDKLAAELPERFGVVISTTSHPPKEHEADGTNYHFLVKEEYEAAIDDGKMLEHVRCHSEHLDLEGKRYKYGTSLQAVREVAGGGKVCLAALNWEGVAQLRADHRVEAHYVHVHPRSEQVLRERLIARLKEHESTVQKRLEHAREELLIAQPGGPPKPPAAEGADADADADADAAAEEGDVSVPEQTTYHEVLLVDDIDELYYQMKVAVSPLSPIIRNRLRGLPSYILDYSDVIPSNNTERPIIKPVVLTGPNFREKAVIEKAALEEFPEVFASPKIITTKPQRPKYASEDEPEEPEHSGMTHVSDADFDAAVGAGEYAVTWTDQFVHETLVYRYAIPKETLEEAARDEKLCLCVLPTAAASDAFKESREGDVMSLYLGPATIETYEERLRAWLRESDESIEKMMKAAAETRHRGFTDGLFDVELTDDDESEALESFKDIIRLVRPDVIAPRDPSEGKKTPKPVIICGPENVGKKTLRDKLFEEHEGKLVNVIRHTTRAPAEGEEDGVSFHFVDRATFESEIVAGAFAETSEEDGELFGTSLAAVQAATDDEKIPVLCDVSVDAARGLNAKYPDGAYCYVAPPNMEEYRSRLLNPPLAEGEEPPPPPEPAAPAEGEDADGEPAEPEDPPEIV